VPALALILLAGVAVRVALWLPFRHDPIHIADERDYNALAGNLVGCGEYTFHPGGPATSLRPPLYPALVAGVYAVAGVENFAAVRLVQAVLSLLTVVVLYRLGRELLSPRAATWLAGLACFYPSLLVFNNLILTEVLFTLLLTTSCYLLVLALRRESLAYLALGGATLGLAALTRSVVWLSPPFLAVFLLVAWKGGWGRRLAAAAAVSAAFAVTIAPWAVRNTRLQDTFVAIDTMGGRNFMMGNYRYTPLYRSWDAISVSGEESWEHEVFTTYPYELRPTQGRVDKLALRQGVEFVKQHPGITAQRSLVKFFDFWGLEREIIAGAGQGNFGRVSRAMLLALTVVIAGGYAAVLFLAVFGAVLAPPADRRASWLLLCVIAFVCGLHTLAFAHSRYHLPVIPLVLIFTAAALGNARSIWRRRRTWSFRVAGCVCVVFVAGWLWSVLMVDWEKFAAAWRSAV
jgi:4-amino-4-deoxy-L-arabinose transferase-like glycosyltransferase